MKHAILNEKPIDVFVIIAETLEKWQNQSTPEGNLVLMEHYKWGTELKEKNKIMLAGPTNLDLMASGTLNPIGLTTGIIMLNVKTREEAKLWAEKDPFHVHGFRRNVVHSMKITITEISVFETLEKLNNQS
ncbi:MAG: hypothetical protein EBR19_03680 [Chitinophagaceae bacterium]|jgi:uncharacterized protein YciI|nr:hypothetical protein [Chitinophagaceae bacterium]